MNSAHLSQEHQPPQCGICYETYVHAAAVYLPCFHHICDDCIGRLLKPICPFCRLDFSNELRNFKQTNVAPRINGILQERNHQQHTNILDNIDHYVDHYVDLFDDDRSRQSIRHRRRMRKYRNRRPNTSYNNNGSGSQSLYEFYIIFQTSTSTDQENQQPSSKSSSKSSRINHRISRPQQSRPNHSKSILHVR